VQITKYSHRIDPLSTSWTPENIEKMVDEAYRVNELAREAAELELEELFPECEAERKTVGIVGMIGWYAGRLLWKNTR
jgi:hypothetical protein